MQARSRLLTAVFAFATLALLPLTANAEGGTYKRKVNQAINVSVSGGKLYCRRASDGFEMCNGMTKSGGAWKGANMKHPDMPAFMTFNGTVVMSASSLSIKGCAVGQSLCDSETWTK